MLRHIQFRLHMLLLAVAALTFTACLKDPITPTPPGGDAARARVEITDAPIDDKNVQGVFVTVVDIRVDGKSWDGFDGKTTFDLLAYQKGQTKLLGEGELEAGTYSEIELVFDAEADANGDAPGCYVKDAQGNKKPLATNDEVEIKVKGNIETKSGETTEAIIDFDLRKAIVYQFGSSTDYQFVTEPELQASARLMDKAQTGLISGDCTDGVSGSDKIIVFAYKKGTWDPVMEKFPQGTSQVQFKNAVTSSVVASNGNFDLNFLEAGAYELHFISFKEDVTGKMQAKGELQINLLDSTLSLLNLTVNATERIDLDMTVTGILFF